MTTQTDETSHANSQLMSAARLHAIGDFRIDQVPVPTPKGKELLLKVDSCGICGSDIPRVYSLGTSKQQYPLTIGHEFAGTIVAVGPDESQDMIGKRGAIFPLIPCRKCASCVTGNYAMCEDYDYLGSRRDGGFADYCLIPDKWHFVESHNPEVSMAALAMTEPACVAQHAVRKSGMTAGANVLIFGAGPIGIMAARWAKIFGAKTVTLVDIMEDKITFGAKLGLDVINSATEALPAAYTARTGGKLADVVLECTGSSAALNNGIHCVKAFGNITLVGNPFGNTTIGMQEHSMLLRKEATITAIWNSHFAPMPINEWEYTVNMMDNGQFCVDDLITHTCKLDQLPHLMDQIHDHEITICKAMYSDSLESNV